MKFLDWLFGRKMEMYIRNWDRRFIPDEPVEETRAMTEKERLEAHIEKIRRIPRES